MLTPLLGRVRDHVAKTAVAAKSNSLKPGERHFTVARVEVLVDVWGQDDLDADVRDRRCSRCRVLLFLGWHVGHYGFVRVIRIPRILMEACEENIRRFCILGWLLANFADDLLLLRRLLVLGWCLGWCLGWLRANFAVDNLAKTAVDTLLFRRRRRRRIRPHWQWPAPQ